MWSERVASMLILRQDSIDNDWEYAVTSIIR